MTPAGLLVEQRDAARWIIFDRPAQMNAVTTELLRAAAEHVREAASNPDVRVIVLAGAGSNFCTGADLGAIDVDDPQACSAVVLAANELVTAIAEAARPVVVRARGACVGVGASLALVADLAFADNESYLMLSFARIGLMPDGGATALVAAASGRTTAMRLALMAERVWGAEAAAAGLVSGTWSKDEYDDRFGKVIATLGSGPTRAYAATKAAINDAAWGDLTGVLARESAGQDELVRGSEFAEGLRAFRERRRPRFRSS